MFSFDMKCLMNCPKICPINLLWESGLLHRLSAILSLWPCWEWWLDLSQPAIDGLALNWDDWVVLLCMHMYISLCVPYCVLSELTMCAMLPSLETTAYLFRSISFPPLIWILSSLNHWQHCFALPLAYWYRAGWFSFEQRFLSQTSNHYQDLTECRPCG